MKRLQGFEWTDYKRTHHLKLACISITKAGNYRADVMDEHGNWFNHYLGDSEVSKLMASKYLETHTLYNLEDLLKDDKKLLKQLRCELKERCRGK